MRITFSQWGASSIEAGIEARKTLNTMRVGFLALAIFSCAASFAGAEQPARPMDLFRQLRLDGNYVRWPTPDGVSSPVLTYRVLGEFQTFDGARNCRRMKGIEDVEARSHITRDKFSAELKLAFAMWESAANIRFREAAENEVANITIGAQADPEGWAFADVFYDSRSSEAVKPISRALVCLNPMKAWKIGFDGDLRVYDLRYTLAHEIGHAIGLDHPNGPGQMMGYRYEENFRELQAGDLSGAMALYGPARQTETARSPTVDADVQTAAAVDRRNSTSRALHPKSE